ncbi:MAG: hypothetical protein GTO14_15370 [Anaerolineales bacterium]|nr:hypothetical protein [Anaerolineales bacterium]
MGNHLDEILSLAERTYIRAEAEHLIDACLDAGDLRPFDDLLHELVLAGSSSLLVLREVLQVIRTMKSRLSQEGLDIRQGLMQALSEFGVHVPDVLYSIEPESFWHICRQDLHHELKRASGDLKVEDAALLQEICSDAGNRVAQVAKRLVMVVELENSVRDWIEGLAYVTIHASEAGVVPGDVLLQH